MYPSTAKEKGKMKGMNEKELNAYTKAIRENERLKLEIEKLKAEIAELSEKLKDKAEQA